MLRLVLATAALAGPVMAAQTEGPAYLGDYRIESVTRYRGGLTTEAQAKAFIGQHVSLATDRFQIRAVIVKNPVYKTYSIRIDQKEGSIVPNDTSVFYGFRDDRKDVRRVDVYSRTSGKLASYPDDTFEDLGDGRLLEMYDGWFIILRKQA